MYSLRISILLCRIFVKKKSVVLNKRKNIYDFLASLIVLVIITKLFGYNSMIEQIFTKSYSLFFVAGLVGFYNIISLSNIIINIPTINCHIHLSNNLDIIIYVVSIIKVLTKAVA